MIKKQNGKNKKFNTETAKDFIFKMFDGNIEMVSEFTKVKDKHIFKCNKHNLEFEKSFDSIRNSKYGCSKCAHEYRGLLRRKK